MAFSNFIPELWSARLLATLDKELVFASVFNHDYEGEISQMGDTVHINQLSDVTVSDYTGADINAAEDLDSDAQTLTIDQAKYFNFRIKDIDNAQSTPKLMSAAMERAGYSMQAAIDANLAAYLTTAGTKLTSAAITTAEAAYNKLVDLSVAMDEKNVPKQNRHVIIPPWFYGLLLHDDRFVSYGTDKNRTTLENGIIGSAAGFTIHESNNCTVSNVDNIFAVHPMGASYAQQIAEIKPYSPENNFADAVKGLTVFGRKVTLADCVQVQPITKS